MAKTVSKKELPWFEVLLGGRLVDVIRAADLVEASELAGFTWDKTAAISYTPGEDGATGVSLEVRPLRAKAVVQKATPKEVLTYAGSGAEMRNPFASAVRSNTWPFGPVAPTHADSEI